MFLEERGSIDFRNVDMLFNSASYGGAIGVDPFSIVAVTDGTFTGNTAIYSGGAIYGFLGTLTIQRCTFDMHSAIYGGVAFLKVCVLGCVCAAAELQLPDVLVPFLPITVRHHLRCGGHHHDEQHRHFGMWLSQCKLSLLDLCVYDGCCRLAVRGFCSVRWSLVRGRRV